MEINGRQAFKYEEKSLVCFWETTSKNEFASATEGRPVFDVVLMGMIMTPGAKMSIFEFEIERRIHGGMIKQRVNERSEKWVDILEPQLSAWKKGREDLDLSGTPLESWPRLDVAMIASLKASGVHSLEQLSEVPDSRLDILGMNGRRLRDQAKAHIELARENAPMEKVIAQNADLQDQIIALQAQIKELSDKHATEDQKRGPGRPPKQAA